MKTDGQLLYEHKHPSYIPVVPLDRRAFTTAADVLMMPAHQVAWNLLTERCRQEWEVTAHGHNFFSGRQA